MPFRTEASVLQDARDLIADPDHWTQGYGARTAEGYNIHPTSFGATSFCAVGAVNRVTGGKPNLMEPALTSLRAAVLEGAPSGARTSGPITTFNDNHTHAEVLAMFDRAIASVRQDAEAVG